MMSRQMREILNQYADTAILDRPEVGESEGLSDWWAIRLEKPKACGHCGFSWPFYWDNVPEGRVSRHLVIVWPSEDDPAMLRLLERLDGEAVPYEVSFGEAESWYSLNPS